DRRDRHADRDALEAMAQPRGLEHAAHEGEPARLAAPRAAAAAVEPPARELEALAFEVLDHALAAGLAVLADRADEVLAQGPDARIILQAARPQLVGERELGARLEPARKVVARRVIGDRGFRHRGELLAELAQIGGA